MGTCMSSRARATRPRKWVDWPAGGLLVCWCEPRVTRATTCVRARCGEDNLSVVLTTGSVLSHDGHSAKDRDLSVRHTEYRPAHFHGYSKGSGLHVCCWFLYHSTSNQNQGIWVCEKEAGKYLSPASVQVKSAFLHLADKTKSAYRHLADKTKTPSITAVRQAEPRPRQL